MKKIILFALIALSGALMAAPAHAATPAPDDEESVRLNLWIPGVLIKWAADIADDHMKGEEAVAMDFMRNLGSMNICIREGAAYKDHMDNKMTRKLNRMERRDYEPLISVVTPEENVQMQIRTNKRDKIKSFVVMVNETDEAFVYVKMRCNLKPEEVNQLIRAMDSF